MSGRSSRARPAPGRRLALGAALASALASTPAAPAAAQRPGAHHDSIPGGKAGAPRGSRRAWVAGAVASYLLHEAGHVGAALALGARPTFRFDRGRPTVFSGMDIVTDRHRQLVFSSMGLGLQALADEAILDVPGLSRSSFARGAMASGLGTALFYVTAGRNGAVSDVALISRTSGLSKGRVSLIVGGVAAMHALRFSTRHGAGALFARPDGEGRLRVGWER